MNTHPIAQKIKAAYLRAVNNEMVGDYQPSFVANLMRRIVELIFRTPDFAIELPIEPQWRDYYATALCISAYLGYVQYTLIADDTLAVITLTDPYRAQILAASTTATTDTAATAAAPTTPPTASNQWLVGAQYFAPASTTPPTAPPTTATDNAVESPSETTPAPTPAECSECSEPPTTPAEAAANFRLKAVTTASLEGSLCNSRGQGRRGRPQPSDSHQQRIKSAKTQPCPHKPRPSPLSPAATTIIAPIRPITPIRPIRLISPTAMPPPHPPRPPTTRLSAAII